ncbi:MAG: hypothetical protein ACRCWR_06120 [Saezia sp.]
MNPGSQTGIKPEYARNFAEGWNSFWQVPVKSSAYKKAINAQINARTGGIRQRDTYHWIKINWETERNKETFEAGNIQGSAYYHCQGKSTVVVACGGYLFSLHLDGPYTASGRALNVARRTKWARRAYFTHTREGLIYNDGDGLPVLLPYDGGNPIQADPFADPEQIGPGLDSEVIQGRLFWIHPDRQSIRFSTYGQPLSLDEPLLSNTIGFKPIYSPDNSPITSLGKYSYGTSSGFFRESLVFSTENDMYIVDVSGPLPDVNDNNGNWRVNHLFGGIGNYSKDFLVRSGNNLYFRSRNYGIGSVSATMGQQRNDSFSSQSGPVDDFISDVPGDLLSEAFAFGSRNGLHCSVSPRVVDRNGVGQIVWRGLLNQRHQFGQAVWESCSTGLNWINGGSFEIDNGAHQGIGHFSVDEDGINRLYLESPYNNKLFDVSEYKKKSVKWRVDLRDFYFGSEIQQKTLNSARISLGEFSGKVICQLCCSFDGGKGNVNLMEFNAKTDLCNDHQMPIGHGSADKEVTSDICQIPFTFASVSVGFQGYAELRSVVIYPQGTPHAYNSRCDFAPVKKYGFALPDFNYKLTR